MKVIIILLFLGNPLYCISQKSIIDNIILYQKYISNIRGGECQMYPSCSNYGLNAFKYKPIFEAIVLTSDRLMRCSHDFRFYETKMINNKLRFVDTIKHKNKNIEQNIYNERSYNMSKSIESDYVYYLFKNNNYDLVINEIEKKFYYNRFICSDNIFKYYLISMRKEKKYEDALYNYEKKFPNNIKLNPEIILEIGNINLKLKNYSIARKYYNTVNNKSENNFNKNKSISLIGLSYVYEEMIDSALHYYSNVDSTDFYYEGAKKNKILLNDYLLTKKKKTYIAGILSIIPGAGYFYASHKYTAVSALIVNGLLMWATYNSYKLKNYGLGTLTGVFGLSFYIGNIVGSIKSAKRYNKSMFLRYLKKVEYNTFY